MKKSIPALVLLVAVGVVAAVLGVRYLKSTGKFPLGGSEKPAVTAPEAAAPGGDEVMATVNGTKITRAEVNHQMDLIARQMGLPQDPSHQAQISAMLEQRAVESLIQRTLLIQVAEKEKITVQPAEVDKELATIKQHFSTPEEFNQKLQEMKMDEPTLRSSIEQNLVLQKVVSAHTATDTAVTDDEIKKFYNANQDKIKQPEMVRASHILIGVADGDTPGQKAAKKKQAEDILAQIKKGADFAGLAKQYSADPGSKDTGGDLNFFTREQMVKPFADEAFSLKKGQLSDKLVETQYGYHIIKKTDQKAATMPKLAEVKDKIKQELERTKENDSIKKYLDQLTAAAQITRADKTGAGQPNLPPGHPPVPTGDAEAGAPPAPAPAGEAGAPPSGEPGAAPSGEATSPK
jgi:parvulin-like peptidyl-prolyl isomerase